MILKAGVIRQMIKTEDIVYKIDYIADQYFNQNKSMIVIAKELGTYPNKIRRAFKQAGYSLRNKSEAQKLALFTGRIAHPTEGTKRSEETKDAIADSLVKSWDNLPKKELDRRRKIAKKMWHDKPESEKQAMHEKAKLAILDAAKNGSKPEKFLMKKLAENNYEYVFHANDLIANGKNYEFDFYLPELNLVIEIDGHFHRNSVWGRDHLKSVQELDERKSKLVLNNGYCIIRYEYRNNDSSRSSLNRMWNKLEPVIQNISKTFPSKDNRLIFLESE